MKKKSLSLLLAICMLGTALTGCGEEKAPKTESDDKEITKDEDYNFNIIVQSFQSTYWQAAVTGIDQASEEYGVSVDCTGPNSESDIADQVNMLNNAINSNPDGIAIAPCDQNAVFDSLETALEKEIPIICFDSGVENAPEGSVYCTIASDNYASGGSGRNDSDSPVRRPDHYFDCCLSSGLGRKGFFGKDEAV